MIFGVGTDICDVRRIQASLERHGERFAQKDPVRRRTGHLAAPQRALERNAACVTWQRAFQRQGGVFSKAIGLGMRPAYDLAALRNRQPAQWSTRDRAAR
jgi:holo-[acyl-carrier protein] synthase